MTETEKGFVQLHASVLLAGFTGLFGRLITLNEVDIVWYRMLFTSCVLIVFTGLPRVGWRKFLQIQALKRLSAFTVNLTYNLEPCYTIALAFLIFGEGREINFSFYVGLTLILLSVLLQTRRAWKA